MLVKCGHCHRFIERDEATCPFCGEVRETTQWRNALAFVLFGGLAVATVACDDEKDGGDEASETTGDDTESGSEGNGEESSEDDWGEGGSDYAGPPIFAFS